MIKAWLQCDAHHNTLKLSYLSGSDCPILCNAVLYTIAVFSISSSI